MSAPRVEEPAFPAYFLVGPTCTGKTRVAQWIAERGPYEIVSADSMQVYRGMDIGTAKPTLKERAGVVYHGLDLVDPGRRFSVAEYRDCVLRVLPEIARRGRRAIVVGGSGLYLRALLEGLRPGPAPLGEGRDRWERLLSEGGVDALAAELERRAPDQWRALRDRRNPRRLIRALERSEAAPEVGACQWRDPRESPPLPGLTLEPEALRSAIERRVRDMYDGGLLDEVRRVQQGGAGLSRTALQAIGYAEAVEVIAGGMSRREAMERTAARTRQLAKRQRTWFRHQARVVWMEGWPASGVEQTAQRVQDHWRKYGPLEIRR
jgi:tRNA dimethylallyltransferase